MDLVAILAWVLLGMLLWYTLKPMYERFSVKSSDVWLNRLFGEFEMLGLSYTQLRVGGTPIVGITPSTCPKSNPDLEGGLCYVKCRPGYHGAVTMCVADTFGVGIGTPVGLEDCPKGWKDDGLTCRAELKWNGCKSKGLFGECYGGLEGGQVVGRLDNGGVCPGPGGSEYKDKVDGLCYKKCPKDYPIHLPGMPYLCYKGGPLTYDRGVGKIPHFFQLLGTTSYETNIL